MGELFSKKHVLEDLIELIKSGHKQLQLSTKATWNNLQKGEDKKIF